MNQPGSIAATLPRLEADRWWPALRGMRPSNAELHRAICLRDVLLWLEAEGQRSEKCTDAELAAHEATLDLFRLAPHGAYVRMAREFVDFVSARGTVRLTDITQFAAPEKGRAEH